MEISPVVVFFLVNSIIKINLNWNNSVSIAPTVMLMWNWYSGYVDVQNKEAIDIDWKNLVPN